MKVTFSLIHLGRMLSQQEKEYDGSEEANMREVEDDQLDGMDPLELARKGEPATWIEAKIHDPS